MMRQCVQESVLSVLPMPWHRPGPETPMVCLLFSAINIDLDYITSGILKYNHLKKEELKRQNSLKTVSSFQTVVLPVPFHL